MPADVNNANTVLQLGYIAYLYCSLLFEGTFLNDQTEEWSRVDLNLKTGGYADNREYPAAKRSVIINLYCISVNRPLKGPLGSYTWLLHLHKQEVKD